MAFKVGDAARLKSGGPRMTVTAIHSPDGINLERADLMYFDRYDVLHRLAMPVELLEAVPTLSAATVAALYSMEIPQGGRLLSMLANGLVAPEDAPGKDWYQAHRDLATEAKRQAQLMEEHIDRPARENAAKD